MNLHYICIQYYSILLIGKGERKMYKVYSIIPIDSKFFVIKKNGESILYCTSLKSAKKAIDKGLT